MVEVKVGELSELGLEVLRMITFVIQATRWGGYFLSSQAIRFKFIQLEFMSSLGKSGVVGSLRPY